MLQNYKWPFPSDWDDDPTEAEIAELYGEWCNVCKTFDCCCDAIENQIEREKGE